MKNIIVAVPSDPDFIDVKAAIKIALESMDHELNLNLIDGDADKWWVEHESKEQVDLIIIDMSSRKMGCAYFLGYSDAKNIPRIIITADSLKFFGNIVEYDRSRLTLIEEKLKDATEKAIQNPKEYIRGGIAPIEHDDCPRVFISYSHEDKAYLDRLRVHLKPLERENLIDTWDDTQIKAGENWQKVIETALERAAIAILLISPDFLASDFIIDNELPPLLSAAANKGTCILRTNSEQIGTATVYCWQNKYNSYILYSCHELQEL